jgi:hypothetical protein
MILIKKNNRMPYLGEPNVLEFQVNDFVFYLGIFIIFINLLEKPATQNMIRVKLKFEHKKTLTWSNLI